MLFEVGPTINACTRGLWVYPTTFSVKAKDGTQLRVLFVDSEGLGAVGSAQQHDLQVFSISMLIRCPPPLPPGADRRGARSSSQDERWRQFAPHSAYFRSGYLQKIYRAVRE